MDNSYLSTLVDLGLEVDISEKEVINFVSRFRKEEHLYMCKRAIESISSINKAIGEMSYHKGEIYGNEG